MNKNYLIVLLFACRLFANAQSYIPFPNTFAIWTCFHYSGFSWPNHTHHQKYGMFGDTVMYGFTYKKIYQTYDTIHFSMSHAFYEGAIREANKRIYVRYHYDPTTESLLYDFNLNVGDTAKVEGSSIVPRHAVVDSVDYVMINGRSHKRWKFNASGFHYDEYWIEGVGSTFGVMIPLRNGSDNCYTLMCMSKDTELVYQYSVPADPPCPVLLNYDCDERLATSLPEKHADKVNALIFPNPFSHTAKLRFEKELKDAIILIYDMFGKQAAVYEQLSGKEVVFHKHQLDQGHYFYTLLQDGTMISKGSFVVE